MRQEMEGVLVAMPFGSAAFAQGGEILLLQLLDLLDQRSREPV